MLLFGGGSSAEVQPVSLDQPLELLPPVEADAAIALPELERMALAANPSVARAAALARAARGEWVQVGLAPNPLVGYEGQQIGSGGQAEQHGVLLTQEIVRGGKLQLNRAIAGREVAIAEQRLAVQELQVLTDVRVAFYETLLAEQQIQLAENLIGIGSEGARAVQVLYQAKEVGRADVLQAQLEVENARIQAQNARNRRDAAWRRLSAVVGSRQLAPSALAGDLAETVPPLTYAETLARLQGASPEVAVAALQVDRARAVLERAQVEATPNLLFSGLVNWQDNGIGGKPDGGVALTAPLPLWDKNQGAIRQAQQQLIAARRAADQLSLDLQSRLASVFERYANAHSQVERYRREILPAADESLQLVREGYSVGEANYIGLLTAQRTFAQTNWNYLEALGALRVAAAEIDGFLLTGSLRLADQLAD